MDITNGDSCWSCQYSDFDPVSGELICSCNAEQRPESCPLENSNKDNIVNIDSHTKTSRFGSMWRKQA